MTDAEYLIFMAEFLPPWHQERVEKIAWRLDKISIYMLHKVDCLCCHNHKICADECTFSIDFPELYDKMLLAREVLYGGLK